MILTGDGHQAMVDQPLAALGLKRRVALRIPFFYSRGVRHHRNRSRSYCPPHLGDNYGASRWFTEG